MKFLSLFFLLSMVLASVSFAEPKDARKEDVAQSYELMSNGDFFRYVEVKGTAKTVKCQITDKVSEFKVNMHNGDVVMVYFVRNGDLYFLKNNNKSSSNNCPGADKEVRMKNVKEYKLVPSTETTLVSAAMNKAGEWHAWELDGTEWYITSSNGHDVKDFAINPCFSQKGKAFSSYVMFVLDKSGYVLKIKGEKPKESKWDSSKTYSDLQEFKAKNNVCN